MANDAIHDVQHDNADIKVYTNGSGMEGKIGAAAILYWSRRMKAQGIQCISLSIHGPDTGGFCPSAMVQLMWAHGVP